MERGECVSPRRVQGDDNLCHVCGGAGDRSRGTKLRCGQIEEIECRIAVDHGLLRRRNPAAQSLTDGNRKRSQAGNVHALDGHR